MPATETMNRGWPRSNERNLRKNKTKTKQEKYCKGKVVTFIVQSLILLQCPADLVTY